MASPPPVVIRPETAADYPSIRRVVDEAFGDEPIEVLVERIRNSPGYWPDLSLVAELDGEVVGHVMVSAATLRHSAGDRQIAQLSPLAVDPPRHGQGIGEALVRTVAELTSERGEPFMVLEGSPLYYSRFGFEPAAKYRITMPIPDWAPLEAAQLLPLANFNPEDPELNGEVIYPSPFDGL